MSEEIKICTHGKSIVAYCEYCNPNVSQGTTNTAQWLIDKWQDAPKIQYKTNMPTHDETNLPNISAHFSPDEFPPPPSVIPIYREQPSPDLLLHLRFVVLNDAVVMERLHISSESSFYDRVYCEELKPMCDFVKSYSIHYGQTELNQLRIIIDAWANSLNDDKPVPRMEATEDYSHGYYVYLTNDDNEVVLVYDYQIKATNHRRTNPNLHPEEVSK